MLTIVHAGGKPDTATRLRRACPHGSVASIPPGALTRLDRGNLPDALIVDGHIIAGCGLLGVTTLKTLYPELAVLAYVEPGHYAARTILELGHAHIDDILIAGIDDHPDRFRKALEGARASTVACAVEAVTGRLPPTLARPGLDRLLRDPTSLLTAGAAADVLGVGLRRFRQDLQASRLFPPKPFVAWLRMLLGARHLGDGHDTVERIGLLLGYSSAVAFRHACRRVVGTTATDIRGGGGLRFAVERFRQAVRVGPRHRSA